LGSAFSSSLIACRAWPTAASCSFFASALVSPARASDAGSDIDTANIVLRIVLIRNLPCS